MCGLREKLETMTHERDVLQHPALLASLTRDCPNTIRLVSSPYPIERYTCLMHALDFTEKTEYVAIAGRGLGLVFAGGRFAHLLLDEGLLAEKTREEAHEGDLVFYFDDDARFKHAGLITGGSRVLSKWGTGHLVEHELQEVPESYGTACRFFAKPSYDEAYTAFRRFAEECGTLFEEAS
jgi:hypothetical protein